MFILTAFRSLAKFTNNSYIFFEILLDFRSTQECQYRLDVSFLEFALQGSRLPHGSALKTTLPVHITVLKLECEPQSFYVSLNTARFTYGRLVFLA